MLETVVPYARFLEIRLRRQRVVAELTKPPVAPAAGNAPREPVTIDCEVVSDQQCGTRSTLEAGTPEGRVGRDYQRAGSVAGWTVRPGAARDRDGG